MKLRLVSGVLLSIFSATLILIQGCFITWNKTYPEILFYIVTIISIICAVIMFITQSENHRE